MATNSKYKIEAATNADLLQLKALIESAYRGESAKQGWTHEADLLDGFRLSDDALAKTLADENARIFVARNLENNCIDGTICIELGEDGAEFGKFAVNPNIQAGGIGKLLLEHAEAFAKNQWHQETMKLSVITVRTELIDYYVRRGYVPTGKFIAMQDIHSGETWTKGHDLMLEVYEKPL